MLVYLLLKELPYDLKPRTKKSIFSVDFSAKNWILVVLEKIFGWKNRLQKNR